MRWNSFLAIGDSFTEGMDDPLADGYRGWADLLAENLAAADPSFRYANLAVRGKLFDEIVDEQVPVALRAAPELVSFAGGGNDALRPSFNPHTMATRLHEVVRMLSAVSSTVVLVTAADATYSLPGRRLLGPRIKVLNDSIRRVADRHDAVLVDLYPDTTFHDRRMWSTDRLHLSELGHKRVAGLVQQALGIDPEPSWMKPLDPVPPTSWFAARKSDAAWAKTHLAPWVKRRVAKESSGDTVTAKRPELRPWSDGVS